MLLPDAPDRGDDLELFTYPIDGHTQSRHASHGRINWKLGFGPVGGKHPVWGLYRLEATGHDPTDRLLLWRSNPTEAELFRWASREVGSTLAALLLQTVGDIDHFYMQYFASRPDLRPTAAGETISGISTTSQIPGIDEPIPCPQALGRQTNR